jgi:hypothetical protein
MFEYQPADQLSWDLYSFPQSFSQIHILIYHSQSSSQRWYMSY